MSKNQKDFHAGERVTYLDIIHATVLHSSANGVTIAYQGRGLKLGEQIVSRVAAKWLDKGWHELKSPLGSAKNEE